jgi:hypothetical protein
MTTLYAKGQKWTKKGKERLLYSKRQNSAVKPAGLAMNETQHDLGGRVFFLAKTHVREPGF